MTPRSTGEADEKQVTLDDLRHALERTDGPRPDGEGPAVEAWYHALLDTLPLAAYVDRVDRSDGASWVSAQIEKITSRTPEEWLGNPGLFAEVVHPEDAEHILAESRRVRESGGSRDDEYRIVRRDGTIVWVHDRARAIEADGRRHVQGFIVDITDRRSAELELERQNEHLRQLDGLKDEFIALVSHELRTPLTSIRGYLELMSEDSNLTEEQVRFLETIDRNAHRLQRVVGDLLFVAQVEAGKLALEAGTVDLNTLVADALEAARPAAAAKTIAFETQLDQVPEIPGDRARLAQTLDNLISNAIKFTPGGGTVTVQTLTRPGEVEVIVSDTGMGIPADELPRLFQRFFRAERATSAAIPGTGLGLAIVKAIVTGHGGRIRVTSEEGAGTTFRIILPG